MKDWKGQRTDEYVANAIRDSWRTGKNMVVGKNGAGLTNEEGFELKTPISGRVWTFLGAIPINDEIVTFIQIVGTLINELEVGIIQRNGVYRPIISGINGVWTNTIEGVYSTNYLGERIIAWWDGVVENNPPMILNIDNLPFEVDGTTFEALVDEDENLLRLFPDLKYPTFNIYNAELAGGNFDVGTYYLLIRYKIGDGDYTNYVGISAPVMTAAKDNFTAVVYNIIDGKSPITFDVIISNLDTSFKVFNLIAIKKYDNVIEAEEVGEFDITSDTITIHYTGQKTKKVIDYQEALINVTNLVGIQTGTLLDNELITANTITRQEINYQKYANNINVNGDCFDSSNVPLNTTQAIINIKGLRPGEVEALYIHLIYNDGSLSKGFHIPGREAQLVTFSTDYFHFLYSAFGAMTQVSGTTSYIYIGGATGDDGYNGELFAALAILKDFVNTGAVLERNTNPDQSIISVSIVNLLGYFQIQIELSGALPVVANGEPLRINMEVYENTPYFPLFANNGNPVTAEYRIAKEQRYFHLKDTSSAGGSFQQLGYWENDNEFYPDTEDFDVWGASGSGIVNLSTLPIIDPDYRPTLRNKKVRHHKMPDWKLTTYLPTIAGATIAINVSNIVIPTDILDQIQGVTFSYSLKTQKEKIVQGTAAGAAYRNDIDTTFIPDYVRFLDYNLLTRAPVIEIYPKYLKVLYGQAVASDLIYNVNDFQYQPSNNAATVPPNYYVNGANRENCLSLHVPQYPVSPDINLRLSTGNFTPFSVFNLCQFILNAHLFFDNRELALADTILYTPLLNIFNTIKGFNTITAGTNVGYTVSNSGFVSNLDTVVFDIGYQFLGYNNINNIYALGNMKYIENFNSKIKTTDIFEHRVFRSNPIRTESLEIGWRTFFVDRYYDVIRNKGVIWKLAVDEGKNLIIHLENTMLLAKLKDVLASSVAETYLGVSDIFDRTPDEILYDDVKYGGCQNKWAAINCKHGYIFADRKSGKIFQFYNKTLTELSKEGKYKFFAENLNSYNSFEKVSYNLRYKDDNPAVNGGLILGYDERHDRLLVTNHRYYYDNLKSMLVSKPYTISYSFKNKAWAFFHDYFPELYCRTSERLYLFRNLRTAFGSSNGLATQVAQFSETKFGKYFYNTAGTTQAKKECYVDLVYTFEQLEKIKSLDWETFTKQLIFSATPELLGEATVANDTITAVSLRTENQYTGKITVNSKTGAWFNRNVNNDYTTWHFNQFADISKNTKGIIVDEFEEVLVLTPDLALNWFDKSKLISKFVVVRLYYDNASGNEITITDAKVNSQPVYLK